MEFHGSPYGPRAGGVASTPPVNSDEENAWMKQRDDELRALYLKDPSSKELSDPYVSLIDVYSNEHYKSFMLSNLSQKELTIPHVMDQWVKLPSAPTTSIGRPCSS